MDKFDAAKEILNIYDSNEFTENVMIYVKLYHRSEILEYLNLVEKSTVELLNSLISDTQIPEDK